MLILRTLQAFLGQVYRYLSGKPKPSFPGSREYWEHRYAKGGDSGFGSYGKLARFKAKIINDFVDVNRIESVIEFGCGDGNQLKMVTFPNYLGFDISQTSIQRCRMIFHGDHSKSFKPLSEYENESADLTLSLDVIFHLIEDEIFEDHMNKLFKSSKKYVIIYSSNSTNIERFEGAHVKHRNFTQWIDNHIKGWVLIKHIPNKYPYKNKLRVGSFADFYIYQKV